MGETVKHTPGPWKASQTYPLGDWCIHAKGTPQQLAYLAASSVVDWPLEANARLIAAAPDLFAAAQDGWRMCLALIIAAEQEGKPLAEDHYAVTSLPRFAAAIAKAKGEPLPAPPAQGGR